MKLIDAHCHLDFKNFDHDRDAVIQRADDVGVEHIVISGVRQQDWSKIASMIKRYNGLSACYGLHPYLVDSHLKQDLESLTEWLEKNTCVAVGECGLDYRKGQADKDKQQYYFEAQLAIAQQVDKPVVIHSVRATEKVITTLRRFPDVTGMVHSYSGSTEQALQLIDMGFYLSFGGAVTYKNATRLRETVKRLPLESILLETDAPDQPDELHHSERNEPAYLSTIVSNIAELRTDTVQNIAQQTYSNTIALFAINT